MPSPPWRLSEYVVHFQYPVYPERPLPFLREQIALKPSKVLPLNSISSMATGRTRPPGLRVVGLEIEYIEAHPPPDGVHDDTALLI